MDYCQVTADHPYSPLEQLLIAADMAGASDLHLTPRRAPYIRYLGELKPLISDDIPEILPSQTTLFQWLLAKCTEQEKQQLKKQGSLDFGDSLLLANGEQLRIRGHYFYNHAGLTAIFRLIKANIPSLEAIHAPPIFQSLLHQKQGLILITGATGSGKSTTLASMIETINEQQAKHIITLEDPIEFIYPQGQSLIEQRELHRHTGAFHKALKDALRADPDILLIGELRDRESVQLALQAAETGHLVFATLHTNSAAKSIDRLLSYYPLDQSLEIRQQLSESLVAVISQQLLTIEAKRFALFEVLIRTTAVANLIRENQIAQIPNIIQTGSGDGMQTMQQQLEFLRKSGILSDLFVEKAQNLLNPDIYS
ncbi:type IV pili twitching motility protein PilT [Ignatzschineria ureiclastica]|uniref:Type IV pili twitching motility protein PilT n=1 Tax=Ignatzschineria ureiclastica TaxID=472582 RepID=A0A2U2AGN6_9GAMM|nr:PilT/PilU family type 4a pilus ATPase [Ignatzschineria ureiclastica]PWD81815.1 type IV pili twitching motility protein PilT [Ignatzschineria ureiclastica]GGZ90714.1 hypothetical protein GCM10007162_02070 [Ignatzschineria ureiclastica]